MSSVELRTTVLDQWTGPKPFYSPPTLKQGTDRDPLSVFDVLLLYFNAPPGLSLFRRSDIAFHTFSARPRVRFNNSAVFYIGNPDAFGIFVRRRGFFRFLSRFRRHSFPSVRPSVRPFISFPSLITPQPCAGFVRGACKRNSTRTTFLRINLFVSYYHFLIINRKRSTEKRLHVKCRVP